eukprot:c4041_g2_i1 orf=80-250(+)
MKLEGKPKAHTPEKKAKENRGSTASMIAKKLLDEEKNKSSYRRPNDRRKVGAQKHN